MWWRCAQNFVIASCAEMPRDNRCMYMAHVCFYVCCSDCVGVCGNVCCVAAVVKNSVFFSLGVLKYVVCLCRGCDGCCVFCLYCEAWSCRCSCMGSVSVSSCRCCMFVSCVHHVAVLNAAFCMTCSVLMLLEDAIGDHTRTITVALDMGKAFDTINIHTLSRKLIHTKISDTIIRLI